MHKFLNYYSSEVGRYGGIHAYVTAKAKEKHALLSRVQSHATITGRVLEAGCGSGANLIHLANQSLIATGVDNDPVMLEFAEKNATSFVKKPIFVKADIKELPYDNLYFDVTFSHGVLEHFTDDEIVNLLNKELHISRYVILSVPSDFFKQNQAINGDERFLPASHWEKLIEQSNGVLKESFVYFYDSNELRMRLLKALDMLTFGLLPRKKPYIGFVVRHE